MKNLLKFGAIIIVLGSIAYWGWWSLESRPESKQSDSRSFSAVTKKDTPIENPTNNVVRSKPVHAILTTRIDSPVTQAILKLLQENADDSKPVTDELKAILDQLSEEERKIVQLNLLLNRGKRKEALEIAKALVSSSNSDVRLQVVVALEWIGAGGIGTLTQMLGDENPEVVQDATDAWLSVFDEVGDEELSSGALYDLLPTLQNRELIDKALMSVTRMNTETALQTVSSIIADNGGNETLQEAARDMWSHLTGGETYENESSVEDYLSRKEQEQKEAREFLRELAAAQEAGDEARVRELLGLPSDDTLVNQETIPETPGEDVSVEEISH